MNDPVINERLVQLLIDRATVGLSASEETELKSLLDDLAIDDDFSFDYVAQLLFDSEQPNQLFGGESEMKSLPDHIRSQVVDEAQQHVVTKNVMPKRAGSSMALGRRELFAWFAAAACLVIASVVLFGRGNTDFKSEELIASATQAELDLFLNDSSDQDVLEIKLNNGNSSLAKNASATVYWNRKLKRGFLEIDGLAANNSNDEQYQLWVIDKVRGIEDRPNAGVFDIASAGKNVFTFRSELEVFDAQGFAITVEKPGGVSKSDLSQVALLNLDGS